MALISRDVKVFGVPGIALVDYDDWLAQCQHEFEHGILKAVS